MTHSPAHPVLSTFPGRLAQLRWSHAAIILVAIFAAANWQLLTGAAYEKWDAYGLAAPYYSLLADFARAGHFLYWNPWVAAGSPDFAAAGSGTFSPDLLLFAALTGPGAQGYILYWLFIWLSGGIGMLLLARQLKAPAWGALVVSLGYVFSGFYTGHAEHTSVVYSHSLLPFVIWRLDVALSQRRFFAAAQAGVLWGLSGLTGYPALTLAAAGLIGAWWCGRAFLDRDNNNSAASKSQGFLIVLLIAVVGILVLSPSYFSAAYESRGYSDRSEPLERNFALTSNALHPAALATLSSPSIPALKLAHPDWWAETDISGLSLYTGSVTLLLAIFGLTSKRERAWRWFIFACGLFALGCAMSAALPLRGWLYDLLPPTRYFRHASMLRGTFLFSLAVLALRGAADLTEARVTQQLVRLIFLISGGLVVVAIANFAFFVASAAGAYPSFPLAVLHSLIAWGGLLIVALIVRWRATWLPAALIGLAALDALVSYSLASATIYDRGPRPALAEASESSIALGPASFARELGDGGKNLNLFRKIPVFKSYAPLKNRFYELSATVPALGGVALGADRIWFAEDVPEIALSRNVFDRFKDEAVRREAPLFVRHSRAAMLSEYHPAPADLARIAA
ncbi:MAG: YfhO family protein, partial [Verrucomicrobiota bacterium]|nr:YfhO family protein [Verrucomicrobiota bacterium]